MIVTVTSQTQNKFTGQEYVKTEVAVVVRPEWNLAQVLRKIAKDSPLQYQHIVDRHFTIEVSS